MKKLPLPRYEIRRARNDEFYWAFISKNGEVISKSSETYTDKDNAKHSIALLNEGNVAVLDVSKKKK